MKLTVAIFLTSYLWCYPALSAFPIRGTPTCETLNDAVDSEDLEKMGAVVQYIADGLALVDDTMHPKDRLVVRLEDTLILSAAVLVLQKCRKDASLSAAGVIGIVVEALRGMSIP